ncbi:MAG TPA: hypothetical protein VII02_08060 [Gemmatimonadaceae bacterium]
MSRKVVIHIFHDDESSLNTAAHVAERIRQVMDEQGVSLEVFVFGPAEKALAASAGAEMRDSLVALAKEGVPVLTCRNTAEAIGKAVEFTQMGIGLEYARDAFVRYAVEGATVISF